MPDNLKPLELAQMGLIGTINMARFSVDQRLIDDALGAHEVGPQQGGPGDLGPVQHGAAQFSSHGSAVSHGGGSPGTR